MSNWVLARAVAAAGQLGVVSGTALAVVLVRRLQLGDIGGHMRRAMDHFPVPHIATRIRERYFIPGGKAPEASFKLAPMPTLGPCTEATELAVLANFVEVFLARETHGGLIGINYLEKLQIPTLPSLFGAMLAGVDFVLMGAGIPMNIPGALDRFAGYEKARLNIDVEGAIPTDDFIAEFDPRAFCGQLTPPVKRPQFLAIISSATLATALARRANGQINGFVVEGATAGGHNAPPRGNLQLNQRGEPLYGPRDAADLEKIRSLGLPFWLAGGFARTIKLAEARSAGAAGIQVGTPFAFCEESGIKPEIKQQVLAMSRAGTADVFTDPVASPTGFPFKVLSVEGSISDPAIYAARKRICDLGYLRHPYRKDDGTIGYRCAAEPAEHYSAKGGDANDCTGRKCLCNGLSATVGIGQISAGGCEKPIITAGDDVATIARFLPPGRDSYTAADVIHRILAS